MDTPDTDVAALEAAVVALRRSQKRRALARLSERRGERISPYADLPDAVVELLDTIAAEAARGDALTVTRAAAALGVDQPRASRLTAQALDAGLLCRRADQRDGRRSLLALTPEGQAVLDRVRDFRRRVIAEAVGDWPDEERGELARLLARFVRDFCAVTGS
ncbi:MarR family winged helix-turn-helix transcriptional regulator [Streptomyces spirodelae]|uniref:Winged helix-turn-helix transcriptional regulator n=1 Tax=Streptomyces spirodelae TaxID=2812904 RepID=A0ABS3WLU3_9ACTN|nr:MarR family winged helix-turn-helix transcriptional regulator [Streptomyces spirodelae]MBO8184085.1 winged helix-turn-helix transcriptional regulator [Streptomyces spirodelae]